MPIAWGDVGADGLANNRQIYQHPTSRIEAYPRDEINDTMATVTATTYYTMVYLEHGQLLTNLGCYVGATAAVTPTSSWLGLWTHPAAPPVRTTLLAATTGVSVFSSVFTAGSATVTIASGTYPNELRDRLLTATSVAAGVWIKDQTTTTLTLSSGTGITAATRNATVGQFAPAWTNIAVTTNGTTTAIPANTAYTRPLVAPIVIPAAGLYMFSVTIAATTMPTLCAKVATANVPLAVFSDAPQWARSHVNGTTNNTAPGTNPATSAGTFTDLRAIPYLFAT